MLVSSDAFAVSPSPVASSSKTNGCRVPSCKKFDAFHSQIVKTPEPSETVRTPEPNETVRTPEPNTSTAVQEWRRQCGCLRTSEKLKRILNCFPAPPPPSPMFNNDPTAYSDPLVIYITFYYGPIT